MSSDGLRHEGEMASPDKDTVYAQLRKRGIRAIKVTERITPVVRKGFAGLRKRDWLLIVCGAFAIVVCALFFALRIDVDGPASGAQDSLAARQVISSPAFQFAQPRPRRFVQLPEDTDFSKVFRYPHESYLARYAMPGVVLPDVPEVDKALVQDFYDNINIGIIITEADDAPVAELKRIVMGMKDDAKKYLGVPGGIEKLSLWLEERQAMEKGYRDQFINRVKKGEMKKSDANDMFNAMGLETF